MLGTDYPFPLGDLTAGQQLQESQVIPAATKVSQSVLLFMFRTELPKNRPL